MGQKIEIEFKDIKEMRYPTVGDYYMREDGVLKFEIADTGDLFLNKCILIHEIAEQALTEKKGIPEQSIMDFDLEYEEKIKRGEVSEYSEPGFDNNAPYLQEHTIATSIEMIMCAHAGIKWQEYEQVINSL